MNCYIFTKSLDLCVISTWSVCPIFIGDVWVIFYQNEFYDNLACGVVIVVIIYRVIA